MIHTNTEMWSIQHRRFYSNYIYNIENSPLIEYTQCVPSFNSNMDTLIHLLKGALGTGILAMPYAFHHSGYLLGSIATIIIGVVCTYCVHILLGSMYELCKRKKVIVNLTQTNTIHYLKSQDKILNKTKSVWLCICRFQVWRILKLQEPPFSKVPAGASTWNRILGMYPHQFQSWIACHYSKSSNLSLGRLRLQWHSQPLPYDLPIRLLLRLYSFRWS